jgi:prepilin-type N-terminal cleavage/methylation domain-containing protein
MFRKINNSIFGFTLAEVLIALVVIGIVVAITVPTLIQRYQDQAIKSALKKNYSVLKSALDKYQVDYGERLVANGIKDQELKPKLIKYLNVTKDYGFSSFNLSVYKEYNGKTNIAQFWFDDGQFVLQDGSFIFLENGGGRGVVFISVDVNGYAKKPNRLGKDLFMFQLNNKGELLPMGAKGTYYYSATDEYCSNTSTTNVNGAACTAKVLRD